LPATSEHCHNIAIHCVLGVNRGKASESEKREIKKRREIKEEE
jgi:hypothetical protein